MKDVKSTAAIIHLTKTIRKSGAAEKYVWVVSWLMSYGAITTRVNKKKKSYKTKGNHGFSGTGRPGKEILK